MKKKEKTAQDYLDEAGFAPAAGEKTAQDYLNEAAAATPKPKAEAAPPAPRETHSMGESALHGVGDYASMGFLDEAAGAVGAVAEHPETLSALGQLPGAAGAIPAALGWIGNKFKWDTPEEAAAKELGKAAPPTRSLGDAYRAHRDAFRATQNESADDHPIAYHGAGIAASVLNPVGSAKTGSTLLRRTLGAAGTGGAQGFGSSTADLTKGDALGAAKDTAIGAGTGAGAEAIASGVGRILRGKRVDKLGEDIMSEAARGGSGPTTSPIQNKQLRRAEDPIRDLVVNQANPAQGDVVRKAMQGNPKEGLAALEPVFAETGAARERAYQAIEAAGAGHVDVNAYLAKLGKAANEADKAGDTTMLKALQAHAQAVQDYAQAHGGDLTLRQLRGQVSGVQAHAAGVLGGLNQTSAGAQALKQVEGVATKAMDDTMTELAAQTPGIAHEVEAIRANNRKYQAVKTIADALQQRANKMPVQPGGLERLGKAAAKSAAGGVLGAGAGYALGGDDKIQHAVEGALGGAAIAALPRIGRAGDRALTTSAIKAERGASQVAPGMLGRTRELGTKKVVNSALLRALGIGKRKPEQQDEGNR